MCGTGAPSDPGQAILWFRRSAEQGFAHAQFCLALAYAQGDGVQQDLAQSAAWYRRAADQGNLGAERNLHALLNSCSTEVVH